MRPIVAVALALAACAPKPNQPTAEQLALGERAYQKCYSCHSLEPGKNDLDGPTLHRVVGRAIAAQPGFDYSPAMRRFAQREDEWAKGLLDKFIADPDAIVPGTSMNFGGIPSAEQRQALVAYLEAQTKASAASLP